MKFIFSAILFIQILSSFATKTLTYSGFLKQTIVLNPNTPSIYYYEKDNEKYSNLHSMEHILPKCFLQKCHYNDMHNIIRTLNKINIQRSNYKFVNENEIDNNCKQIPYENYVNHKNGLFIPNKSSRGIISRCLLYMSYEYNYNLTKIIDKENLIDWYFQYPPCKKEKYHNKIVTELQRKDNIFISKYKHKSKRIINFFEKL